MTPIERMLAERECERLQVSYALAADCGDADAFTALFVSDAVIHIPEYPPFAGHAAIHDSLLGLAGTGVTMRHVISNQQVTVTAPESATGICYLIVYNNPDQADEHGIREVRPPATVGEYRDQFTRTAEGWRFSERRLTRVFRPRP